MTLQDIFDGVGSNPTFAIMYFVLVPLLAVLFGWISKGEELQSPWRYIYSGLVYATVIPGIFAATLCIYTFLFSRTNFLNVNVIVYFLPIISMLTTLFIIQRQIDVDEIPGLGKLSGFVMTISAVMVCMFILDRTRTPTFVSGDVSVVPFRFEEGLQIVKGGDARNYRLVI
jgi:hypothetical protein